MSQPLRVLPGMNDVARARLADPDDLFRLAFDNAPIGMILASPDIKSVQVNRAFCEMLGYSEEEILAADLWSFTHPDDVAANVALVQRALAGDIDTYEIEKRYLHRDGHIVWGRLHGALARDATGAPRYFVSQIEDITARKAADEALAASEERFRIAFENAPIGMALVGADQRPVQVNRALCTMLGYSEHELLETTLRELTHPDDIAGNAALVERAQDGELDSFTLEKRYIRKDGEIVWATLTASFVRDDTGAPLYFISQIQDISARKAAEAELAQTQLGARQILERITDAFYTLDREWRFSYVNAAAERVFNRPRADLLGKEIWTEFASALETPVYDAYRQAMATGTPVELEFFYPAFDAWYKVDAYPSEDGLAVFFRDVTEPRRLLHELRASEAKFRTLVEQLPVVVYTQANDERQTSTYFSPQFSTMTGYSIAEIMDQPADEHWYHFLHPDDLERIAADDAQSTATGEPFRSEYRLRRRDGSYVWVQDECVAVRDDSGEIVAWQGVLLDISDRVKAEEAQARFVALVNSATDAIIGVDLQGIITSWNRGAERLYGYTADEIIGQPTDRLRPADFFDPLRDKRTAAARSGQTVEPFETMRRRKDGTPFAASVSLSHIRNRNGEVIGISSITRDITARKKADEALHAALDAAQAASRAKSAFLAMMSHELRTPLQAVMGYAEFLLAGAEETLTAEQREDIGYIHQGGNRMMGLIGQMLDLSRIEAGALQVTRAPVDLGEILEQVRQDVAPQAEGKGLTLTIDAQRLPEVMGDALRLRQILLNLVGNAVKFTDQGSVRVQAVASGNEVTVTVRDTGIGIPADALPHIFEEFRQVDGSLTRRYGGAGLGLAIAQKLAGLMGSEITVESKAGFGSTFSLRLPAARGGGGGFVLGGDSPAGLRGRRTKRTDKTADSLLNPKRSVSP